MAHGRFGGRTLARSQAMQLLFQAEANKRSVGSVLADEYLISDGPLEDYARELAMGAYDMLDRIDGIIEQASQNWSVSRMPNADRCLLRVAVYELLEQPEVDAAVAISECVELAKAFGTDESSRFVNGVLGRIARDLGMNEAAAAAEAAAAEADAAEADDADDGEAAGNGEAADNSEAEE